MQNMANLNRGLISSYQLINGEYPAVERVVLSKDDYLDSNGNIKYKTGALIATDASVETYGDSYYLWDSTADKKLVPSTGNQVLVGIVLQDGVYPVKGSSNTVTSTANIVITDTGVFQGQNYVAGNIRASSGLSPVSAKAVIGNVPSLNGIYVGMSISGIGIPKDSTVLNMATASGINYLLISGNVTTAGTGVAVTLSSLTQLNLTYNVVKYAPKTWFRVGSVENDTYLFGANGSTDASVGLLQRAILGNLESGNINGGLCIRFNGLISTY